VSFNYIIIINYEQQLLFNHNHLVDMQVYRQKTRNNLVVLLVIIYTAIIMALLYIRRRYIKLYFLQH